MERSPTPAPADRPNESAVATPPSDRAVDADGQVVEPAADDAGRDGAWSALLLGVALLLLLCIALTLAAAARAAG